MLSWWIQSYGQAGEELSLEQKRFIAMIAHAKEDILWSQCMECTNFGSLLHMSHLQMADDLPQIEPSSNVGEGCMLGEHYQEYLPYLDKDKFLPNLFDGLTWKKTFFWGVGLKKLVHKYNEGNIRTAWEGQRLLPTLSKKVGPSSWSRNLEACYRWENNSRVFLLTQW